MLGNDFVRIALAGAVALLAAAAPAQAAICFSGFSDTVKYNFDVAPATFETPGTYSVPGVEFGKLTPCAGLKKWPIVGTVTVTATSVVLGFRALTVAKTACGAPDYIVAMTPKRLSGVMQLHNDRNNFSNSTTFVQTPCTVPPLDDPFPMYATQRGFDAQGN
jgi:hypothetical protein